MTMRRIRNTYAFASGALFAIGDWFNGLKRVRERAKEFMAELDQLNQYATASGANLLYHTVGKALSAWAEMEERMVSIVALLLRADRSEKAGVLLYNIYNFGNWIEATHDLFRLDSELGEFQDKFGKITKRLQGLKTKRDRLAHHPVRPDKVEIAYPTFDARTKSKGQPLSLREVVEFTSTVVNASMEMEKLIIAMREKLVASPQTSPEQATDLSSQSDSPPRPTHTESEGQPPPSQGLP